MTDARLCAVILAAGSSTRMGEDKLAMRFGGKTPLEACVETFLSCEPGFDEVIIAVSDTTREAAAQFARRFDKIRIAEGGAERGESVYNALMCAHGDIVAIHDCARCLVDKATVERTVADALHFGSGIASIPARDTLHGPDGIIPRESVRMAQTPQTFALDRIRDAYARARENGVSATDDCAVYRMAGWEPHFSDGTVTNQKLTGPADIPLFSAVMGGSTVKIGYGEDTHRLSEGRKLILGGVEIPNKKGLLGHSDADVAVHAVIDALLGAAGLPDIGRQFPDSCDEYAGISSIELLARTSALVEKAGYRPGNIDITIIAQAPKLAPYTDTMCENIARAAGLYKGRVNVKATTTEGLGPEGRGEGMTARCVCILLAIN